jgi:hypothetical protein
MIREPEDEGAAIAPALWVACRLQLEDGVDWTNNLEGSTLVNSVVQITYSTL